MSPVSCSGNCSFGIEDAQYMEFFSELLCLKPEFLNELIYDGKLRLKQLQIVIDSVMNKVIKPSYCGAGISHLTVDTDGSCYECHRLTGDNKSYMGSIYDEKFKANIIGEYRDILVGDECSYCKIRNFCKGGCIAERRVLTSEKWLLVCEFMNNLVGLALEILANDYLRKDKQYY